MYPTRSPVPFTGKAEYALYRNTGSITAKTGSWVVLHQANWSADGPNGAFYIFYTSVSGQSCTSAGYKQYRIKIGSVYLPDSDGELTYMYTNYNKYEEYTMIAGPKAFNKATY